MMMILGIDEDDVNNGDVGDSDKVYHDDEDGDDNEDDNNRNRSYLLRCQTKVHLIPLDTIGGSVVNKHQSNTMKKSRGEAVTVRH